MSAALTTNGIWGYDPPSLRMLADCVKAPLDTWNRNAQIATGVSYDVCDALHFPPRIDPNGLATAAWEREVTAYKQAIASHVNAAKSEGCTLTSCDGAMGEDCDISRPENISPFHVQTLLRGVLRARYIMMHEIRDNDHQLPFTTLNIALAKQSYYPTDIHPDVYWADGSLPNPDGMPKITPDVVQTAVNAVLSDSNSGSSLRR